MKKRRRSRWLCLCFAAAVCMFVDAGVHAQTQPSVVIAQPAEGATVHDNEGNVVVTIAIEGIGFSETRVLLDRKPYGPPPRTPSFVLEAVDRGEHVLQVQLVDASGHVLASSPPVMFFLWRASARFPAHKK